MSARLSLFAVALASVAFASACSLVKLSDDVTQAHCKNDKECDVLNSHKPGSNPCELWQCSDTKYCEFTPLDSDHDGFTPATAPGSTRVCQPVAAKQDCDESMDTGAVSNPGAKERCDGADNDCDTYIDEGVLKAHVTDNLAFTGDSAQGAGDVSYAIDPDSGKLAVAYSINHDLNVPGFSVLDNDLPSGGNATVLSLDMSGAGLLADGVGVTPLGNGKFAVALFDQISKDKRVIAGRVDVSSSGASLVATTDIVAHGLHCGAAEDCSVTTPKTRTPAISATGDDVLVSYVRADPDPSALCKNKTDTVAGAPLFANLLAVSSDGLAEKTAKAVTLGDSGALTAPAIVAVPEPTAGKIYGWLVAYVNADGAIVIKNVRVSGNTLAVSSPLATLASGTYRYSGVHMALGPTTDTGQLIGVSFQRGCTVDARIGVTILSASLAANGDAKLATVTGETLVGGAPNEKDANLAYNKEHDSWGVAYRDPMGLRARVLDQKGKALGTDAYVLLADVASGANMSKVFLTPAVVPTLTTDGWFGTLVYNEHMGTNPRQFTAVTLASCGGKQN